MNTQQALSAVALTLLSATAAHAGADVRLQHYGAAQSSAVTRAEVRNEVLKAQADGTLATPGEVLASTVPSRRYVTVQATRTAAQEQARVQARADTYRDRARIGAGF